jgi:hypothetical protein
MSELPSYLSEGRSEPEPIGASAPRTGSPELGIGLEWVSAGTGPAASAKRRPETPSGRLQLLLNFRT